MDNNNNNNKILIQRPINSILLSDTLQTYALAQEMQACKGMFFDEGGILQYVQLI